MRYVDDDAYVALLNFICRAKNKIIKKNLAEGEESSYAVRYSCYTHGYRSGLHTRLLSRRDSVNACKMMDQPIRQFKSHSYDDVSTISNGVAIIPRLYRLLSLHSRHNGGVFLTRGVQSGREADRGTATPCPSWTRLAHCFLLSRQMQRSTHPRRDERLSAPL